MNMNQKGFANIILIILVVVLVGALGYVTLVKRLAPIEHSQPNDSQNAQSPTPVNTTVNWQAYFDSQNLPSAPLGVVLPQNCRVVGAGSKMVDLAYKTFAGFEWSVDCGSRNNKARGTLGPALEQQGWKFCDSQTATGHWWKNGVITGIAESAGASYPFKVWQQSGTDCP
ncbi:MAG: hypothetical protein HYT40_03485 [Candidatus Sungbacteria bacterium]|uniref:Uncharacterized protein n=1 Tax=Candidatus Sungiibacteriota bacterium TaxID=2750080 RepID=A0A931WNC8_9BACT|nr:hypothetical protein [Candidatus Sungbacteria bacterium]